METKSTTSDSNFKNTDLIMQQALTAYEKLIPKHPAADQHQGARTCILGNRFAYILGSERVLAVWDIAGQRFYDINA